MVDTPGLLLRGLGLPRHGRICWGPMRGRAESSRRGLGWYRGWTSGWAPRRLHRHLATGKNKIQVWHRWWGDDTAKLPVSVLSSSGNRTLARAFSVLSERLASADTSYDSNPDYVCSIIIGYVERAEACSTHACIYFLLSTKTFVYIHVQHNRGHSGIDHTRENI